MAVATKPTLKLGDEGIYVNNLQTILNMLSYLPEEYITSEFDLRTEHAVKSFQSDWGLKIDGIVGEETWAALEAAMRGEIPSKGLWNWIRKYGLLSALIIGGIGLAIYLGVKK